MHHPDNLRCLNSPYLESQHCKIDCNTTSAVDPGFSVTGRAGNMGCIRQWLSIIYELDIKYQIILTNVNNPVSTTPACRLQQQQVSGRGTLHLLGQIATLYALPSVANWARVVRSGDPWVLVSWGMMGFPVTNTLTHAVTSLNPVPTNSFRLTRKGTTIGFKQCPIV